MICNAFKLNPTITMKNQHIVVNNLEPNIVKIKLNRPQKRNALNIDLLKCLSETLKKLNADKSLRVIIIKGEGPLFCSGLDLKEASDISKSTESAELLAKTFTAIYKSPHVTIAAVHGYAVAGGAGLMCACDLVLAEEETQIGFPETQRGLVASQVLTMLSRQLNQRSIRELLLIGDLINTERAFTMGLINYVIPKGTLDEESLNVAKRVMRGGPNATKETKKIIDAMYPNSFDEDLQKAVRHHEKIRNSDEAIEGFLAFNEKRNPRWME